MIVIVAAFILIAFAGNQAAATEVTLVMNTPDKQQIKGTLKEIKEDGTITLIRAYGEETYARTQYLSATCPEPPEQTLANQSYLKGEYPKALALYETVNSKYGLLGWEAASLEGISKCQLQLGNLDAAIANYSRLLEEYPAYPESRTIKFSLAQACEVKGKLSWAVDLYGQIAVEGDDEASALSYRNIGNIHYARKKYNDALLNYLRVAILYPNLPNAAVPESTFKAADCFEKLAAEEKSPEVATRLRERAKKYFAEVITRFPQSEYARQAQVRYQQLTGGAAAILPSAEGALPTEAGG
jgi:tetratricopeptide (TPR) repeat protein